MVSETPCEYTYKSMPHEMISSLLTIVRNVTFAVSKVCMPESYLNGSYSIYCARVIEVIHSRIFDMLNRLLFVKNPALPYGISKLHTP